MSVIDEMFALAADAERTGKNFIVSQSAKVREELIFLAVFAPIICTNIAVDYCPYVFASDASLGRGSVVSTSVSQKVSEALFLGSDKKGTYSKLEGFPGQLLSAVGEEHADDLKLATEAPGESPEKPMLLYFDFVEFFGGSGRVSAEAQKLGLVVAPPLDLDSSVHYDLEKPRMLEWAFHMIETGRFASFLSEPPCTTFSAAAYPALRSYLIPLGFDPSEPRTQHGNCLALRSFALLRHGRRYRRPCGKEQPRLSKMAWLPQWQQLLDLGFEESVIASCQFNSPHRKEFRFSTYLVDAKSLEVRCPGGHQHLKIEGKHTRPSAVYTHDLARHLAVHFARALRRQRFAADEIMLEGYESVVANDVLVSRQFTCVADWAWRRKSHINVLESRSALEVVKIAARRFESCRVNALLDSRVAKGALSKGRSTAFGLQRVCKASAALQIAADVHMGWNFAPTRLNVADDPTRSVSVRRATSFGFCDLFSRDELQKLHFRGLSKVGANWARLMILVFLTSCCDACTCVSLGGLNNGFDDFEAKQKLSQEATLVFPQGTEDAVTVKLRPSRGDAFWISGLPSSQHSSGFEPLVACHVLSWPSWILHSSAWTLFVIACWIFGISCGFLCLAGIQRVWKGRRAWGLVCVLSLSPAAPERWIWAGPTVVAAMEPSSAADLRRAGYRDPRGIIPTRVVRETTLIAREKLLAEFGAWMFQAEGVLLTPMLTAKPPDPEEICKWLIQYGQQMFLSGKAYGKYAETINAVATARPAIRKQLSPAWDLAFAWLADEPFQHHPALPLSVMLAMITTAILWGWPLEACVIAMTWAGIMRIGETLMATRADLVLPGDSAPGTTFALLRIRSPKTRGRAAKHQAARIEFPDVVQLLEATYADFPADKKLWPFSAATLRKRFTALLKELGLPTTKAGGLRPLDLGSLRPGGATFLLLATENMDLVRRRGRWVSNKVCEIYLQEILYVTYTEKLPSRIRDRIALLAGAFERVLQVAMKFLQTGMPQSMWHTAFKAQDDEELGARGSHGIGISSNSQKTGYAADGNHMRQ